LLGADVVAAYVTQVPEMAFGEYWDTCEYTDGVLNYNQVRICNRTELEMCLSVVASCVS
jgi:hypothetical protein